MLSGSYIPTAYILHKTQSDTRKLSRTNKTQKTGCKAGLLCFKCVSVSGTNLRGRKSGIAAPDKIGARCRRIYEPLRRVHCVKRAHFLISGTIFENRLIAGGFYIVRTFYFFINYLIFYILKMKIDYLKLPKFSVRNCGFNLLNL